MFKRKMLILTITIAFILCFPFHFIYNKFPNLLTSILFPINESIWEHMKLLFGSLIVSGVIEKIITVYKKEDKKNICFSNFIGSILSIPLFLIMFLPLYNLCGENFILTIVLMLITIMISKYISYKLSQMKDFNMENKTIILLIVVYIIFGILTYKPLDNYLFIEVEKCIYEIF